MRLHLPNFHKYGGASVRFAKGGGGPLRLTLEGVDWTIQLDQVPDYDRIKRLLQAHGGYAVGHVGTLARRDGARFASSDAEDVLICLHFFLSFARGFWCAPIIVEGMGARQPLWTEWLSRARVTDWQGVHTWFPSTDAREAGAVFGGFRDLWNQATWRQPLAEIIFWYVDANLNAGAIEGSLVLAHATLERLSWVHFVGHRGLDPDAFDRVDGGAACRIALLLADLNIPLELPSSLVPELAAWASGENVIGGPRVATKVRDTLVHPRRRERMAETSPQVRIQARQLALWYVELVLLALCQYNGPYVNRLHKGPYAFDATMTVPWSPVTGSLGTP
jgi:hypothetical protein